MADENFTWGESVKLAASGTAAAVAMTHPSSGPYPDCECVNTGPNVAYISMAFQAVVPTQGVSNARAILPNTGFVFKKGGATRFSAICDTGNTANLIFTAGKGT